LKRLTIILIAAAVALLAVYYFIGMDYLGQRQRHEALTAQINKATLTLAQTPGPIPGQELKLAAAQANLAAAQGIMPKDLNSTRVINTILKLADACQVKAIPLTTKPWTKENTGQGYYVFRLSMGISGSFPQVTSFVSQLENGEFKTLVIENLNITRVAASSEESVPVTGQMDLAIYTQSIAAQ
jgi:hypothetical protein